MILLLLSYMIVILAS